MVWGSKGSRGTYYCLLNEHIVNCLLLRSIYVYTHRLVVLSVLVGNIFLQWATVNAEFCNCQSA